SKTAVELPMTYYSMWIIIPSYTHAPVPHSFPTRRSSDLATRCGGVNTPYLANTPWTMPAPLPTNATFSPLMLGALGKPVKLPVRSEEHTSELQSRGHLVCRLLLEKKYAPKA